MINMNKNSPKLYYKLVRYLIKLEIPLNQNFIVKNDDEKDDEINDEKDDEKDDENIVFNLLSYSLLKLKNFDLLKILLEGNIDINIKDNTGKTIFHHAILLNENHLFELLREYEDRIDFSV
jgi:ankyrin repeat protein